MTYNDLYTINLTVNNVKIELEPQTYSFSTVENINELYSTASISFNDDSGLIQEYLGTALGSTIELEFGDKNNLNKAKYQINFDSLDQVKEQGYLTGSVNLFLIHNYFFQQKIISKAYQNKISKIIRDLTNLYFSQVDIDDTGNKNIWYQPLISDAKFITDILLPHAYSYNANMTPFYSFITSDDVYHFKNIQSMLDKGKVATIEYRVITGASDDKNYKGIKNKTTYIKRWRNQYKNIWKIQNRNLYAISRKDGSLIEDEDLITDYPSQNNLKLPIMSKNSNKTSWFYSYRSESVTGKKENSLGLRISSQKDGMFIDEFLLIQPFNPKLHAGQTIQLNIYIMSDNNTSKISNNFSGKYIIIECEHIWDGEASSAYTKLIIGRKYISVANAYLLKGQLI